MANFGGKKPLNLGPKMPYLSILGLECFLKMLSSTPSNFCNCKILLRNKNVKIWDQKCHFWVFWIKNLLFGYF